MRRRIARKLQNVRLVTSAATRPLWPGVKLLVNVAESVASDVGVNFCRGDGRMTEQFLDDAKVGAVFEQMGCETVPQHVWSYVSSDVGAMDALFDSKPKGDRGERRPTFGEKDVGR